METVTKVCKYCKREFQFSKRRDALGESYGNYCNVQCRNKAMSSDRTNKIDRTCKRCGKNFQTTMSVIRKGKGIYCSFKCYLEPRETRQCPQCGKSFTVRVNDTKRFCSKKCSYSSKERSEKMLEIRASSGYRIAYDISIKIRNASEKWKDHFQKMRGTGNHNYKDGISRKQRHTEMGRKEYTEWRNAVFQRDDYTCQDCYRKGGNLHAHHVKEWSKYPDSRYTVSNGVTLCIPCHRIRHKTGML